MPRPTLPRKSRKRAKPGDGSLVSNLDFPGETTKPGFLEKLKQIQKQTRNKLNKMKTDSLLGIIRHALTTFGGALVTNGTMTADQLNIGAGAIVAILGIAWSIYDKSKRA